LLRPRPRQGRLQRSPDPLAGFKEAYFYGKKGKGNRKRRRGGKGNGRKGEGPSPQIFGLRTAPSEIQGWIHSSQ